MNFDEREPSTNLGNLGPSMDERKILPGLIPVFNSNNNNNNFTRQRDTSAKMIIESDEVPESVSRRDSMVKNRSPKKLFMMLW